MGRVRNPSYNRVGAVSLGNQVTCTGSKEMTHEFP
jgi:hypothetical protein